MGAQLEKDRPSLEHVRHFWEKNPLSSAAIDLTPGSSAFFKEYDLLRDFNEAPAFADYVHEYGKFAGKGVLEVGCGNAYTLAKYAQQGANVYGTDLTEIAIRISQKRFAYQNVAGTFLVGNAEELPYRTDCFDCICSMGVLHHVPDPEKAVSEIYRCLKPGGRLILMCYHRNSLLYRIAMPMKSLMTGKSLQQIVNEVDGIGNPKGEVYSKGELRHLLRRFRDLEMFAGLLQPSILRSVLPSPVVDMLARKWGWFLYAKGRK